MNRNPCLLRNFWNCP